MQLLLQALPMYPAKPARSARSGAMADGVLAPQCTATGTTLTSWPPTSDLAAVADAAANEAWSAPAASASTESPTRIGCPGPMTIAPQEGSSGLHAASRQADSNRAS